MASKLQFDALLGGDTEVPIEVNTMRFASARAQEIAAISQALDDSKGKLIFQRLPRHMRRRVMGHNPKRMPRNLRDAHSQQLLKSTGGSVTKHKKPSRKHRRRPSNLLDEYNRRQRTFVWLETHIWHAKRFHMTERWGYRLALFPNDRSYRACYRAAANHCLLQDVSFLCCIELTGPLSMLLEGLSKHTYKGLTFAAECYLDGTREGEVMFYESGKAPWQPIGKVSFIWKPCNSSTSLEERKLWIWAHPAFYQSTIAALTDTFQLTSCENDNSSLSGECYSNSNGPVEKKIKIENVEQKSVEDQKLVTRNVPFERTPKFASKCNPIQMALLKDTLNRFRLTGPLSQAVLEEALHLVSQTNENSYSFSDTGLASNAREEENTISSEVSLLDTDPHGREAHHKFWLSNRGLPSPGELPPKLILSLTVKDPRLQIPDKRTKAAPNIYETRCNESPNLPPLPYVSPIWSPRIRDTVTKSKLSTSQLNALRSKLLVPGLLRTSENKDLENDSRSRLEVSVASKIPVMLVQKPGSQDPLTKRLGFGCGWDVILPAGWAMPFWLAFVFRCARPSGLREASAHELEKGLIGMFPPDSKAGVEEMLYIEKDLKDKYFRLPPSKRPNFIKLGISCPFKCDWSSLIRDWVSSDQLIGSNNTEEMPSFPEKYFVLRDHQILLDLNRLMSEIWASLPPKNFADNNQENGTTLTTKFPKFVNQEYSLLPVRLEAVQKGVTDDMSVICIPSSEDIIKILTNSSNNDFVELPNPDKNQDLRQKLRNNHKTLLLRLRRQRVRSKRKLEQQSSESDSRTTNKQNSLRGNNPNHDLVGAHKSKMEELWLPNTNTIGSLKNACSRETAGFVTRGNFSFTEAKGCGVGYISYLALQKLLQMWVDNCPEKIVSTVKSKSVVVLVRSPSSYQYRLAKLYIVVS